MSELQSLAPAPVSSNHGLPDSAVGDQQHDSDQQHPHEFTEAQIEEYKEQDRYLPIANVGRIMKNSLPDNAKIAKEAKECVQECVSEFISFLSSEAAEKVFLDKRKTINGEDILYAMRTLGFDNYNEAGKVYLSKYRLWQMENMPNQPGNHTRPTNSVNTSRMGTPDIWPSTTTQQHYQRQQGVKGMASGRSSGSPVSAERAQQQLKTYMVSSGVGLKRKAEAEEEDLKESQEEEESSDEGIDVKKGDVVDVKRRRS